MALYGDFFPVTQQAGRLQEAADRNTLAMYNADKAERDRQQALIDRELQNQIQAQNYFQQLRASEQHRADALAQQAFQNKMAQEAAAAARAATERQFNYWDKTLEAQKLDKAKEDVFRKGAAEAEVPIIDSQIKDIENLNRTLDDIGSEIESYRLGKPHPNATPEMIAAYKIKPFEWQKGQAVLPRVPPAGISAVDWEKIKGPLGDYASLVNARLSELNNDARAVQAELQKKKSGIDTLSQNMISRGTSYDPELGLLKDLTTSGRQYYLPETKTAKDYWNVPSESEAIKLAGEAKSAWDRDSKTMLRSMAISHPNPQLSNSTSGWIVLSNGKPFGRFNPKTKSWEFSAPKTQTQPPPPPPPVKVASNIRVIEEFPTWALVAYPDGTQKQISLQELKAIKDQQALDVLSSAGSYFRRTPRAQTVDINYGGQLNLQ